MLQLPAASEEAFRHDLYAFEDSKQMAYVTTVERAGMEKGLPAGAGVALTFDRVTKLQLRQNGV